MLRALQQLRQRLIFWLKSLFFLQYYPLALWYSFTRDRRDGSDRSPSSEPLTPVGKLLQATPSDRGARFEFEHAALELEWLTPDFVRLTWQPGQLPLPYALAGHHWQPVQTSLQEQPDGWLLSSHHLSITIAWDGSLTVADEKGQVIRQELPPQRWGAGWQHTAQLRSEECIYGLGERAAALNLRSQATCDRPQTYQLWNYDPGNIYQPGTDPMYITVPVYLGLHRVGSYLAFFENTFRGDLTLADQATLRFEAGALRYYLAVGEPSWLLQRYTQLTGRPPLPPRWAMGYHQSRWGYGSAAAVRQEVDAFQTHNLPLSAVHLDIDCQVNHRSFTLSPQRFPNFKLFIADLSAAGVRVVAINNPGIQASRQNNLFLEGEILNAFCTYPNGDLIGAPVWAGWSVFPDFTDPAVRHWWSRQFTYLLDAGIEGFWNDMNEPSAFVLWGDPTLPLSTRHSLEGRGGDHREAHNVYGMLETRATFESLRRYQPEHRPFVVSRSGWAGLQRYAWTWTGDIVSTWAALRQTIATILGLGLSGIPFCGPDIGGFLGNPGAELYLRWFQMATFLVFYRTHCAVSVSPRAPWTYGEPYLSIMRRFLKLRQQLMPYLYTLVWEASEQGYPPVRPLFWLDSQNEGLWHRDDAFCLGGDLLVCPVMAEGERGLQFSLPPGDWYSFWDDTLWSGSQTIELPAPLEQIPVLVKSGSILPMVAGDRLMLHLYPLGAGDCQGQMYSDAGEGYGPSRLDTWGLTQQEQTLTLTWQHQGAYAFPYAGVKLQVHGPGLQQAWIDGQAAPTKGQTIACTVFETVRLQIDG